MILAALYTVKEIAITPSKAMKIFFSGSIAISLIMHITARIILHLISFPQLKYDLSFIYCHPIYSLYGVFELTIDRSQHMRPW